MAKNKFGFFEVVRIISQKRNLQPFYGRKAVVIGMVESELYPGTFLYDINFLDENDEMKICGDTYEDESVYEADLESMGKKMDESKFYTGESIRVRVNPETGEGELVEETTDEAKEQETKLPSSKKSSLENWSRGVTSPMSPTSSSGRTHPSGGDNSTRSANPLNHQPPDEKKDKSVRK